MRFTVILIRRCNCDITRCLVLHVYAGLINAKDLTFRVQDLEADTAAATHVALKRVLWLQTRAARCPDTVPAVTVNQRMGTSIRGYFGATFRRYDLNECLLPLDPKASLFACENSRDGPRHSRESDIYRRTLRWRVAPLIRHPRFSRITPGFN